jgi:hypothetical protein
MANGGAAALNINSLITKLALPREAGEANKINKLSNRLGKSGFTDLQGISRLSPKQRKLYRRRF